MGGVERSARRKAGAEQQEGCRAGQEEPMTRGHVGPPWGDGRAGIEGFARFLRSVPFGLLRP